MTARDDDRTGPIRAKGADALAAAPRRPGRRRPKADHAPSDLATVVAEILTESSERRWAVAAMEPLLSEDLGDWQLALAALTDTTGIHERSQLVDEIGAAMISRAWTLSWVLWRRGGAPLFLTGAARLVEDVPADAGEAVSRLVRRRNTPTASDVWSEAATYQLRPYDTLRILAYYVDATCDDVAELTGIDRTDVVTACWGAHYDRS